MSADPVEIALFRWAGTFGPFKVNIPCGECSLTVDVIKDTLAHELAGIPVELDSREWLTEWWVPLRRGGWHAPIVLVEDRLVSQGHALNRGVLTEAVIAAHVQRSGVVGNHVFGKATCPHCARRAGSGAHEGTARAAASFPSRLDDGGPALVGARGHGRGAMTQRFKGRGPYAPCTVRVSSGVQLSIP